MTDKQTMTLEEARQLVADHPERYHFTKNGTLFDKEVHLAKRGSGFIAAFASENPHAITPELSRTMHQKRKAQSLVSRIKGRIDAVREEAAKEGIEIPDPDTLTDDELILANGNAERLIYRLYMRAFINAAKDGKNFRGLSEGARFALDPFDEPTQAAPAEAGKISMPPDTLMDLVKMMEAERSAIVDKARAIEVEAK
jgi:hypothetical protein